SVGAKLQQSFLTHGAAQCGACTPGMLIAATALLEKNTAPTEDEVMDAIGGVLCRCTGYRKMIATGLEANSNPTAVPSTDTEAAVGQRLVRLDGQRKVSGTEIFGADEYPRGSLGLRVIRCPYHRAKFCFGDLNAFVENHPSIQAVFTARNVPGKNWYGVIPQF